MVVGSVSVDDDGNVVGTGVALAIFNRMLITHAADIPDPSTPPPDWTGTPESWAATVKPMVVGIKKSYAADINAYTYGLEQWTPAYALTPISSADPIGAQGAMAFDSTYFYIKTAAGWKRTPLSSF